MDENEDTRRRDGQSDIQDTTSSSKKCPECGAPVDDVRVACPKCGYEYKAEDHDKDSVGAEFTAGTAVDDDGNEVPDDPSGT
jgi:ribosomal protein S27AE